MLPFVCRNCKTAEPSAPEEMKNEVLSQHTGLGCWKWHLLEADPLCRTFESTLRKSLFHPRHSSTEKSNHWAITCHTFAEMCQNLQGHGDSVFTGKLLTLLISFRGKQGPLWNLEVKLTLDACDTTICGNVFKLELFFITGTVKCYIHIQCRSVSGNIYRMLWTMLIRKIGRIFILLQFWILFNMFSYFYKLYTNVTIINAKLYLLKHLC